MAVDPITQLRRWTDEIAEDSPYSDAELSDRLGAAANAYAAARDIWMEKLADASGFVNVSEGGSSRSMSQVYDHRKDMVDRFSVLANDGTGNPTGAVLRRITRV